MAILSRLCRRAASVTALVLALGLVATARPTAAPGESVEAVLARAGARVEQLFTRAQSLVCTELVNLQPLDHGLTGEGVGRTVESELHVAWEPGEDGAATSEARARRRVVKVNGRPPRAKDRNNCTAPEVNETETPPLSMLLESQRGDYTFALAGTGKVDGRIALQLDFRENARVTVDVHAVEGNDDCVSYDVKGGLHGRLWVDAESFDVLRMDQHLIGFVDVPLPRELARRPGATPVWTMERFDATYRFKRVSFAEPDETIVLPVSSTILRVTRGAGSPRLRTTTTYKGYKRFLTGGRVVGDERSER